jgi:hypothetical protein
MRLVLTDAATPRTVCATSATAIPRFPPKDRFLKPEAIIAVRVICQGPQVHRQGMEQTVKEPAAGAARLMNGQFVARLRCDRARSRRHHPRSGRHHTRCAGNSARCHRHARRSTRDTARCHHRHTSRATGNTAGCHRHSSRSTRDAAGGHHRHASRSTWGTARSHRHARRSAGDAASRIDTGNARNGWDSAVGCRSTGIGRVATRNGPTSRRRGWRRGRILRGGRIPVRERSILVHFRLQHHPARGQCHERHREHHGIDAEALLLRRRRRTSPALL